MPVEALSGFDSSARHSLKLRFHGNQLTSLTDGVEVARLADASKSARGQCYLACIYDPNLFDNVRIFKLLASGKREGNSATRIVDCSASNAAFVELEASAGVNGFALAAEINVHEASITN
jgi:hypothetical protein